MEDLVNNSWFIGIMGGWISAMLSTCSAFLATYIFTTLIRKKRIENANQFLIDHLRPYIITGNIPSDTLADALRWNAAKRFRVKERDLLSLPSLIAEIAAEVVDGSYLQEKDRIQYLKTIDDYLSRHSRPNDDRKESARQVLSFSIVITFFMSSFFLIGMFEYLKQSPSEFTELLTQIENSDNMHLFLVFLLFSELMFATLLGLPLIFRAMWNIIGNFVAFLKNYLPHKDGNG